MPALLTTLRDALIRESTSKDPYHRWLLTRTRVNGHDVQLATKPGLSAPGAGDPAAAMLAAQMVGLDGDVAVHLGLGDGLVAAASAVVGGAATVWCADRHLPSALATERTLAANGVAARHVRHAHGTHAFPAGIQAGVVTIRVPTERLPLQQLIRDAFDMLREGGRCILAGANAEGAKPAARLLASLFGGARLVAQHSGHRVLVATRQPGAPASTEGFDSPCLDVQAFRELSVQARGRDWRVFTRPGVFSWEHLDEATHVLAETLQVSPGDAVLDLGCGAGLLGTIAARLSGSGRVLLLDADADAVRCAARTVAHAGATNAEVRASDVAAAAGDERFDVVVSNPPFHSGKATDLTLPRQFILEAWQRLVPGGRLFLVANRTLPYERMISDQFGEVRTLHDGARFKVLGATR